MTWNFTLLKNLRAHFLSETPGLKTDYWENTEQLEQYDETFAQRIGWKWDAVLNELFDLGWTPGPDKPRVLDWGCGTGIASRKLLSRFSPELFSGVHYWDRSRLARDFTKKKLSALVGEIPVVEGVQIDPTTPFILVLSHVLNELEQRHLGEEVLSLIAQAQTVIWVEPGTPSTSRRLIEVRENIRGAFQLWAPCPHQEQCGLLALENSRHWCHHFAEPPPEAFQSAEWTRFSRELEIDLRSLPVSYLVLDRRPTPERSARLIGRARLYKGYALALRCAKEGVHDEKIMKNTSSKLFKALKKTHFKVDLP